MKDKETPSAKPAADSTKNIASGRPSSRRGPSAPGEARQGGFTRGRMPGFGGGGGRSGSAMIWVLKNKVPELIMVRTGVSDGAFLEILDKLDPKTEIITGVNYKDAKINANNNMQQRAPGMGMRF